MYHNRWPKMSEMRIKEVDKLFETLKDGKWHNINEAASQANIRKNHIRLILSFLSKFNFVQLDQEKGRIRLDSLTHQFLTKLERTEIVACYDEMTA